VPIQFLNAGNESSWSFVRFLGSVTGHSGEISGSMKVDMVGVVEAVLKIDGAELVFWWGSGGKRRPCRQDDSPECGTKWRWENKRSGSKVTLLSVWLPVRFSLMDDCVGPPGLCNQLFRG